MATVGELMAQQREALKRGKSPPPGPAVLIEAASPHEVLLPKPEEPRKRPVWSTQPYRLDEIEGQQKQERIDRMMALQPLINDDAEVIELRKQGQHASADVCVGRAKRNDVVLADDTISSLHASIQDTGAVRLLIDRNSSNGTWVNREKLKSGEPMVISSGDCIRFGRRVFYFLTGERLLLFLELRIVKSTGQ